MDLVYSWHDYKYWSKILFGTIPGMVGCDEGIVYLTSPGHPADTGLQLGKACYPSSR